MTGKPRSTGLTINVEVIAAVVLAAIAALFLGLAGEGARSWLMPKVLSYVLVAAAVYLLVRGLRGRGTRLLIAPRMLEGKGAAIDLLVFGALAIAYVVLMRPLGFWLVSFLMLLVGSLYLSTSRDRRSVVISVLAASGVCLVFYIVFTYVLYVPLPLQWLDF